MLQKTATRPKAEQPVHPLLAASKAIFDAVVGEVPACVRKELQQYLKDLDSRVGLLAGDYFRQQLDTFRGDFERRLEEQKEAHRSQLEEVQASCQEKQEELMLYYENRLQDVKSFHDAGQGRLEAILKGLPLPQVVIPQHAIQVQVAQPPAQVVIPQDSIHVLVNQQPSQVVVPESAIQVNLAQPRRKSVVSKEIVYDKETGRPSRVIEETSEQDEE